FKIEVSVSFAQPNVRERLHATFYLRIEVGDTTTEFFQRYVEHPDLRYIVGNKPGKSARHQNDEVYVRMLSSQHDGVPHFRKDMTIHVVQAVEDDCIFCCALSLLCDGCRDGCFLEKGFKKGFDQPADGGLFTIEMRSLFGECGGIEHIVSRWK